MFRSEFKILVCVMIGSLIVTTIVYRQPFRPADIPQPKYSLYLQEARHLSNAPARQTFRKQHSSLILPKPSSWGGTFDQQPISVGQRAVLKNRNRSVKTSRPTNGAPQAVQRNIKRPRKKSGPINRVRKTVLESINHPLKAGQEKFLIYACKEEMKCAGLGGRFKGIVTAYLYSKVLNRTFGIDFTNPCDLREFLKPNYINWDIHSSKLNSSSTEFVELFNAPRMGDAYSIIREKLTQNMTAEVVKVHINRNYIPKLFENPLVAQTSPELVKMSVDQVYRTILSDLFLPSDEIITELTSYLSTYVKVSKLVCAHVRIGQNPTIPDEKRVFMSNVTATLETIWRFLDRYNDTNKYRLYIATDAQDVKDTAKHRYSNQFEDTSHQIGHVDLLQTSNDGCNILHKAVLEQLLLASCDVLLLTPSGYGVIAAYMRNSNTDLYCLPDGNTEPEPCNMETLHLKSNLGRF